MALFDLLNYTICYEGLTSTLHILFCKCHSYLQGIVPIEGLEPSLHKELEPKSSVSANFTKWA